MQNHPRPEGVAGGERQDNGSAGTYANLAAQSKAAAAPLIVIDPDDAARAVREAGR